MSALRLILGDQLSKSISSLEGCDLSQDIILMCEVWDEATYVRHHKKKIAFLFSAMRHFAKELKQLGYRVEYIKLSDVNNTGSFRREVERALKCYDLDAVIVTHPGEFRVLADIKQWERDLSIPVDIRSDDRFLCTPEAFADWAQGRKQLRMEYFYRKMRQQYSILMDGGKPTGGQWNYDAENRKPPSKELHVPMPYSSEIDQITQDVIELVDERFSEHFGDMLPFYFAVTREQALQVLQLTPITALPPVSNKRAKASPAIIKSPPSDLLSTLFDRAGIDGYNYGAVGIGSSVAFCCNSRVLSFTASSGNL